ncbi:hypothetical protein [Nocardioides lijunqiniae]|uniref:hypothetical protein n=1 Tax=Nocardioides lijunqiniae TaxID=2760832 RepID=UPI0018775F56|nr:hypothetical protein [Nocardioides lijunqiniae]
MTDTRRPPACHHDRTLDARVTREHRDDCTDPETHNGCVPCTAPHCVLCGRNHTNNDHPLTCPDCISRVRTDLDDIRWSCRHLRWQATRAGRDGRLVAAAPIPGGDAMVMLARAGADAEDLVWSRHLDDDHHAQDVVPPLLPLLGWDHQWRRYFGHQPPAKPSVTGITHYLADHLTQMAQTSTGPDWPGFARDIAALRRQLEAVLHDERDPERGVSCFECGDRLVRKFSAPKPCRHVAQARRAGVTVTQWVYTLSTYPELDDDHTQCTDQGGIADPSVGQSWECIGCRKHYTPGEYANAVRSDLLRAGPDGDGWTHVAMAAEAASTQTGIVFPANTVRRWMDRGKVASLCRWVAGASWGQRLVFWPDVAEEAAAAVERAYVAEQKRAERARQKQQLAAAVASGLDVDEAGRRLGIHPARVEVFVEEWAAEQRQTAS